MLKAMRQKARAFARSNRAQSDAAAETVGLVVTLTVVAIVSAFLLPIGIDELVAVDTSAWSSGAESLWNILDMVVVLALFVMMVGVAMAAADRL